MITIDKLVSILITFCLLTSSSLIGQWQECGSPGNLSYDQYVIAGIVSVGNNLIIGIHDFRDVKLRYDTPIESRGGVYISSDQGMTWKNSSKGLPTISNVINIFETAGNIYIVTGGGIYLSTNVARSWKPARKGLPILSYVDKFVARGDTIIVIVREDLTDERSMYRTTNKGSDWTELPKMELFSFCDLKDKIIAGGLEGNLFKSTDLTPNWDLLNDPPLTPFPQENVIELLPTVADHGFFARTSSSLFHFTKGGADFEKDTYGLPQEGKEIIRLFSINDSVYALYSSRFETNEKCGIYVTTDYGEYWQYADNNGLPRDNSLSEDVEQITDILCVNNNIYVISYSKGIFKRSLSDFLHSIIK